MTCCSNHHPFHTQAVQLQSSISCIPCVLTSCWCVQASGRELLAVSRAGVVIWGIIASGLCCMCTGAYISYNFMGVVLSVSAAGAVFPIFFSLLWNGCTCLGACVGTVCGGCSGLIAWLVTAKKMYEAPSVLSLQNNEPLLAGCCCSIFIGLIVAVTLVRYGIVSASAVLCCAVPCPAVPCCALLCCAVLCMTCLLCMTRLLCMTCLLCAYMHPSLDFKSCCSCCPAVQSSCSSKLSCPACTCCWESHDQSLLSAESDLPAKREV